MNYASSLEEVLKTGLVACFQLRLKNLNDQELINISKVLKPICNKFDVPFILNDRLDLAKQDRSRWSSFRRR